MEVEKLQEPSTDKNNQELTKEVSFLNIEVSKWKHHRSQFDEGIISLNEHKNIIQELREQWAEDIFFQKIQWEKMHEKLKELKKYEPMEKDKKNMLTLTHELLRCRSPSPSYPVFLFEQMILFHIKALREGRPS